jgi:RNA polymerase sigma-70 factor (ECF subfamily)
VNDLNKRHLFERLVIPHFQSAHNLARWLTNHPEDALDLVQEAYLRALKSFDSLDGSDARPWLLAIVRNTYFTWWTERKRRPNERFDEERYALDGFDAVSGGHRLDPQTLFELASERSVVRHFIESLPPEYREALLLREVEEMSYKQIAEIADIPVGTVMSRLSRARSLLLKKLRAYYAEEVQR